MAIPELPFWSIRHNWIQPLTERLEWLTDVLASHSGAEQRRSLRLSPRRFIEMTVNPTRGERTMTDLMLRKLFSNQWLVPLWHDQGKMTVAAALGTNRLVFDNRWREFVTGGWEVLYQDAFTYELVEISDQDDTGIDLAEVTSAAWPKGTKVYPVRQGWMSDQSDTLDAITGTVGEAVVGFMFPANNDYDAGDETYPLYIGKPILTLPPNRVESISAQLGRVTADRDGQTGVIYRADEAGRCFGNQSYSWQVRGREAHHQFRQLLYRLQGRQHPMWLPTFNDDLILARNALGAATTLSVEQAGLGYVGAPFAGREHILIGDEGRKVNGLTGPLGPNEERIVLNTAIDGPLSAGTAISWMDVGRLDQDVVEITHHTDSDGVLECAAVFMAFSDTRDPSGAIYLPIPDSAEASGPCGVPEDVNPCLPNMCQPYPVIFTYAMTDACNPTYGFSAATLYIPPWFSGPIQPNGVGGKFIEGNINVDDGPLYTLYENYDPETNPNLLGQPLYTVNSTVPSHVVVTLYFEVGGHWQFQFQYPAGFCGSVGKDHGRGNVTMSRPGNPWPSCPGSPVVVFIGDIAGGPGNWEFNF